MDARQVAVVVVALGTLLGCGLSQEELDAEEAPFLEINRLWFLDPDAARRAVDRLSPRT